MKYFLAFIFLNTLLFANGSLTIKQSDTAYTVGPYLHYYVDQNDKLSLDEIQSKEFTQHTKDIPNFGFLTPTYWFKLTLNYDTLIEEEKWWLTIDYPLLDYVDLFILDSNNQQLYHKKNGDLTSDVLKDINHNIIIFPIPHNKSKTYTIYLKVKTTSSMLVPIHIMSNKVLIQKTHINQFIFGIYYGILLILILYNTITFTYTKEKIYLLYIMFIISYALWQLSFDGLGIYYFWGDSEWMREKGTVLFIYTSTLTLLIFSQALLRAKENIPKYNKLVLQPIKYITIFGLFLVAFVPYQYTIVLGAILAVLVPATLFSAGLIVIKKDYYSVRLFVLGWGIFLIGTILFTLSKFNLLHGYLVMKYAQQIASAIDMILLSGALAQKFKHLQDEYTLKLQNHNKDLEAKVQIAVQKERQKDKILIEQSRLASMGEMIEQIAHQWRQPLNNIGLINQDMYFKNLLSKLSDEDFEKLHTQIDTNLAYMSNTIDDFRTYYRAAKEKEVYYLNDSIDTILSITEATFKHYKIDISLDIQKGIKVHNLKNELFQVFLNILNNAKDILIEKEQKRKISIKLTSKDMFAYVYIEDNGGGIPHAIISKIFDPYFTTKRDNQGTGIGLYMSKTIIEKNMLGELSVHNVNEGARFIIKLPISTDV